MLTTGIASEGLQYLQLAFDIDLSFGWAGRDALGDLGSMFEVVLALNSTRKTESEG